MRKINEGDYLNYTIVGNGWTLTFWELGKALKEYNNLGSGHTLYGNKPDGKQAILDSK